MPNKTLPDAVREGSADIQQFVTDSALFAASNTLSAEVLLSPMQRLPAEGRAQLVKVRPQLYEIEYAGPADSSRSASVPAYFLGYNGSNQASMTPAYVDIPKQAATGCFLFTGTLSGCSVIVTHQDATTYRVYHDGRVNSSLLYDAVAMAVDYKDYQVSGTAEGLAMAYMQYVSGEWQLVLQRQVYQRIDDRVWPTLRSGEELLSIQRMDSRVVERNQVEFSAYREQVHQKLKLIATMFGVSVAGGADGVYTEGRFSPEHPAISAWGRLCKAVKAAYDVDIQSVLKKRAELQIEQQDSNQADLINQQIDGLNFTYDYYKRGYEPVLREALSVEKTWLWQQIKARHGIDGVLQIDDAALPDGVLEPQPDVLPAQQQQRHIDQVVVAHLQMVEDTPLRSVLAMLDGQRWAERFQHASTRLAQKAELDNRWTPLIDTLEVKDAGHYRVQFISRDPIAPPRWVNSNDSTFVEYHRFINQQMRLRASIGAVAPIDGLNAGVALLALIQWFAAKNRKDQDMALESDSPQLATLLKIHRYLNAGQMIHGAMQDVSRVLEMARTGLSGEELVANTGLKALLNSVNQSAGWLFSGGMVGLDAYELAYAANDQQRAVFSTQLAFDSAGLGTGIAAGAAGLMGYTTAALAFEDSAVLLGGLAVGFTALVQAFSAVAEDAKAVGSYFHMLDIAYKNNGYRYDVKHAVLLPLPGAVIKTLDLSANQIEFDSQYIYSTEYTWIGDLPQINLDREQAIEVRSGIGYRVSRQPLTHGKAEVVVLPCTPKSYIAHDYGLLPFATARNDSGFDVIRRLESERFSYDFYVFPGEQIIRRLRHEYVATTIDVVLDQSNRQLLAPKLPRELQGYLKYVFKGAGGEYLIGLNAGVSVQLARSTPSKWIIDTRQLASDVISVLDHQLQIDGVIVDIDAAHANDIQVIKHNHERLHVNFATGTTGVQSVDASQWSAHHPAIEQHLQALAKAHQLLGQYVLVENYRHNTHSVGRAFYDVAKSRMLFTDTADELATRAQLGAVTDQHVYFYDIETMSVWRVTIATGQVDVQFNPSTRRRGRHAIRLWQEADAVYLLLRYPLRGKPETEELYRILGTKMELVRMLGSNALLHDLSVCNNDYVLLMDYKRATPARRLGRLLQSTHAALVMVYGTDDVGVAHRYWVQVKTGTVIKPNLASPADHDPEVEAGKKPRSTWPIPDDLVLVAGMPADDGREVFFFYSQGQKVLFRQEGPGTTQPNASPSRARRVTHLALSRVVNIHATLIAITEDGRVARVDAQGQLRFEAVTTIPGYGWFDVASGQLFSSTGVPPAHDGQFVGISPKRKEIYIYSPAAQALYRIRDIGTAQKLHITGVKRIGSVLLLQGLGTESLKPPLIAGVDSVVLQGTSLCDSYRLNQEGWAHYRTVVIDLSAQGQALNRLNMPYEPKRFLVSRYADDMLLTDIRAGTVLVLRQAFARQERMNLQIELADTSITSVKHLVRRYTQINTPEERPLELSWASPHLAALVNAVTSAKGYSLEWLME